jgi:hypothetical protein
VQSFLFGSLAGFGEVLGADDHHAAPPNLASFKKGAAGDQDAALFHSN